MAKRMKAAKSAIEAKDYSVVEAVDVLKSQSKVKFDETFEIAMVLGVDPKHADQMVRGMVSLPHGTGKTVRIAAFVGPDKLEEAKAAGADVYGGEDLVESIQKGDIAFDRCVATPDMMPVVSKVAKILGPKGLMPNPKLGTVTPKVGDAIAAAKAGQVEFRVEKAGVIHAGVGKVSFDATQLVENVQAFIAAIQQAKPSGAKGTYIKHVYLTTTMGPSVNIDLDGLQSSKAAA